MTIRQLCMRAAIVAGVLGFGGQALAQPVDVPAIRPMAIEVPHIDLEMVARQLDMAATTLSAMKIEMPSLAFTQDREERDREKQDRDKEAEQRERERETRAYEQGRDFLDQGHFDRAIERFNDVIGMKGSRAEAALYSKAWAQNKAGQRADALATIATLSKDYPNGRYLPQAKALDGEIRRTSGQPPSPADQNDEDLKLMAIQAMQNSDPEQAVPLLAKLLEGTASPKVKSRALFVLAQSESPRAREVMKNIAKGSSTPELQNRAIDYLGTQGGRESRATLARDLLVIVGRRREAADPARVHGCRRKGSPARRRAERAEPRPAGRGRTAARRHGRARRAVAALSEGVRGRREEADHPGDVRRRQHDAVDRAREDREGSRASTDCRAEPRHHGIEADGRRRSSRSTTRTRRRTSGRRSSRACSSRTTPPR